MARVLAWLIATSLLAFQFEASAKGGGGGRSVHSTSRSTASPGTGSNSSSHSVMGHTRKDGAYVQPHKQTNPDKNFRNNYSTKGNQNPHTGKEGTRTEPPRQR